MSNEEFPFTTPATSETSMFIQWKGTNVCLDFTCPCGTESHMDEDFAYFVHCQGCNAVYEMGTQVIARRRRDLTADSVNTKILVPGAWEDEDDPDREAFRADVFPFKGRNP